MSGDERKKLKRRLIDAAKEVAQEFRALDAQGKYSAAEDARGRWRILFRAAAKIDDFIFEE